MSSLKTKHCKILEKYTCAIYGYPREKSVNAVRINSLKRKECKVIDVSLLPTRNSVLILHTKRVNYVANMWKSYLMNWLNSENGWLPDCSDLLGR